MNPTWASSPSEDELARASARELENALKVEDTFLERRRQASMDRLDAHLQAQARLERR